MNIQSFEQNFKTILPGKRLLAVKLDGFSHSAWFDSGSADSEVEQVCFSACAPESPHNTPVSRFLLGKYPHYCYQGNPCSHVWIMPDNR